MHSGSSVVDTRMGGGVGGGFRYRTFACVCVCMCGTHQGTLLWEKHTQMQLQELARLRGRKKLCFWPPGVELLQWV